MEYARTKELLANKSTDIRPEQRENEATGFTFKNLTPGLYEQRLQQTADHRGMSVQDLRKEDQNNQETQAAEQPETNVQASQANMKGRPAPDAADASSSSSGEE